MPLATSPIFAEYTGTRQTNINYNHKRNPLNLIARLDDLNFLGNIAFLIPILKQVHDALNRLGEKSTEIGLNV